MARDCPRDSADEPPKKSKVAPAHRMKKVKTGSRKAKVAESSESESESSENSGKEEL
jgi:hypothetical protein